MKKKPKSEGKSITVNGTKIQMKSIIVDKSGTKYYSTYATEEFKVLSEDRSIYLVDVSSLETKKFLKGFLTVIEDL